MKFEFVKLFQIEGLCVYYRTLPLAFRMKLFKYIFMVTNFQLCLDTVLGLTSKTISRQIVLIWCQKIGILGKLYWP